MDFIVLLLSFLPIILIGFYYYQKDSEKEPKGLLQKLFFSGIISAILVIIISFITIIIFPEYLNLEKASLFKIFLYSFVFVALIEEVCKWLMVYKISYYHKENNQFYDIILYSVFTSLGFAFFENLLYVINHDNSLWVAIFRGITAIPAHACFGTFMGYYLSKSKTQKDNFYLSLLIPILLHGIYDFLILSGNIILVCIFLVFIVTMFVITILKIKQVIRIDLEKLKNDTCPNCHTIIKKNFCPNCGYKK